MRRIGLAVVLSASALAGCGGADAAPAGPVAGAVAGPLRWEGEPTVRTPQRLPDDRVLTGRVRNATLRVVAVASREVRVTDAGGDALEADAAFAQTFNRGSLPRQYPDPDAAPDGERIRTGRLVKLAPGDVAPLVVSWRADGGRPAARVVAAGGTLPLPPAGG